MAWTPAAWHHPLWTMAGDALPADVPGRISLSADDNWTAMMRLLAYALVFCLALQFGRDRTRAQAMFGWLTLAGLLYGVFGLAVYWGGAHPAWLFGERSLAHDLRSTFVNRNHYATWQGLTVICAIAWFHHRMATPEVKPYAVPKDREARVEDFVLKTWRPLTALLLMVAALILTHSRGGFLASLAGVAVLLWLLDRRSRSTRAASRVLVLSALVVAGIAFYLTSEVLLDRIDRTDITTEERLAVFANVNRAIGDNPALGFGYGGFADSFRLYDQNESAVHYDRAHNTWLENAFELGLPASVCLFAALAGLAVTCWRGVGRRHRDWVFPAAGVAASVLVGVHATVDFSLQLPAVAMLYALVMGVACAQSWSTALPTAGHRGYR
jgi:O-antigen ligase